MMTPLLDPVANAPRENGDSLVLAELWISMVGLLRSHLGALQTTGKLTQAVFTQWTDTDIEVEDLSRTLHLSLGQGEAAGEGEWSLTRLGEMIAAGIWELRPDATVAIDGGAAEDMELAVESLARKLWAAPSEGKTR